MKDIIDNGNPMPPSTGDSWTPIRDGEFFCSKACGYKCRLVDFEQATTHAAALVAELGEGWWPRVWENCGWHFSAEKGSASVDYSEIDGNFTASIDAGVFDQRHEQFRANGSSPRKAMEAVLGQLEHKLPHLNEQQSRPPLNR